MTKEKTVVIYGCIVPQIGKLLVQDETKRLFQLVGSV